MYFGQQTKKLSNKNSHFTLFHSENSMDFRCYEKFSSDVLAVWKFSYESTETMTLISFSVCVYRGMCVCVCVRLYMYVSFAILAEKSVALLLATI